MLTDPADQPPRPACGSLGGLQLAVHPTLSAHSLLNPHPSDPTPASFLCCLLCPKLGEVVLGQDPLQGPSVLEKAREKPQPSAQSLSPSLLLRLPQWTWAFLEELVIFSGSSLRNQEEQGLGPRDSPPKLPSSSSRSGCRKEGRLHFCSCNPLSPHLTLNLASAPGLEVPVTQRAG